MSSVLVPSAFLVGNNNQPIGVAYGSTSISGVKVQYQLFGTHPEFKEVILNDNDGQIKQLIWADSHQLVIVYSGKRYFDTINIDNGDSIERVEIDNNKGVINFGCKFNESFTVIDSSLNIYKYDILNDMKKVEQMKVNAIDEQISCFNWVDETSVILGGTKLYKYDLIDGKIVNEISISVHLINNIIIHNDRIVVSSSNERFVNVIDTSNVEAWRICKILTFDSDILKLSVDKKSRDNNMVVCGINEGGNIENFIINEQTSANKKRRSANKLNVRCNSSIKISGSGNVIEDVHINDSKSLSVGYLTSKRSFVVARTGVEDYEIVPELNNNKNGKNSFQIDDDAALPSFQNNGDLVDGNVIITHDKDNDEDDEDEAEEDDFGTIVARAKSIVSGNKINNKSRGNAVVGTLTTSVLQAIRGRDMAALAKVLNETTDENVVRATVAGLDSPAASGLLQALGELAGRSGGGIDSATTWARWVLALHGGGAQTGSIVALHRAMTARARNLETLVAMRARLGVVSTKAQLGRFYNENGDNDDEDDEDVVYVEELDDADIDLDLDADADEDVEMD